MSPIIDGKTNIEEGYFKFVRSGRIIGYESFDLEHADIARMFGIGEQRDETMVIDDGGMLDLDRGIIVLSGLTERCELTSYDVKRARQDSVDLLAGITGKQVKNGY